MIEKSKAYILSIMKVVWGGPKRTETTLVRKAVV